MELISPHIHKEPCTCFFKSRAFLVSTSRRRGCCAQLFFSQCWDGMCLSYFRLLALPRHACVTVNKSFTEALEAYGEAIELDNTNMSFLSNRAAVFFEQKEYEACIAEVSRED